MHGRESKTLSAADGEKARLTVATGPPATTRMGARMLPGSTLFLLIADPRVREHDLSPRGRFL